MTYGRDLCYTTLARLQGLTEAELRKWVLLPLLGRMGLRSPIEYHGPREHGKDIIAFDLDRLGARRYLGVVAKTGNLSGSISDSGGLRSAVFQAEQCFSIPYYDLYGMSQLTMDEAWIITPGEVIPGAADAFFGHFAKYNLNKLVRIIAGADLVRLIDEYYPGYWAEDESIDMIREQRDRSYDVIRKLLAALAVNEADRQRVIEYVRDGKFTPEVQLDGARYFARATA